MSDPGGERIKITEFTGIRNVVPPERQPKGAMSSATNTLIDDSGCHSTRPGYLMTKPHTQITDAYQHDSLDYAVLVDDGNLIVIDRNGNERTLLTGLTDTVFAWTQIEQRILFAGNTDSGMIINGLSVMPLRFPVLLSPNVSAIAGSLPAGVYQVAHLLSHIDTRMEGPLSPVVTSILATGFGLLISPGTVPAGYVSHLYISTPNDPVLRFLTVTSGGVIEVSGADVLVSVPVDPSQIGRAPLPDQVSAIEAHDACLFAAVHDQAQDVSFVYRSEPFAYHWFDARQAGFAVPGSVIQMASTDQGLLIATDAAILLRDNSDNLVTLLSYGAVSGRPIVLDLKSSTHLIWTKRGVVRFTGTVENLFDNKLSVPAGLSCSTAVFEHGGSRYLLSLTDGQGTPFNAFE